VITEKTGILTPIPQNIPPELRLRPQWVVWRPEMRDGKLTKVPYCATTDTLASTTNLLTWTDFETAWGAYEDSDGHCAGVGFVFSSGDPYTFIDLDRCRRPSTGEVAKWAQEIIEQVRDVAYLEASVSGEGVHIILEGRTRGRKHKRGRLEVYSQDRYCAVTGVLL
jgi:putative DNA primase/helicase